MDKKFYLDVPNNVFNFLKTLQKDSIYRYYPTTGGLTRAGKSIELGFSCYAMKIYYMTSNLENLSSEDKNNWVNFINSFQATDSQFPDNSYIDKNLVDSIKSFELSESLKYQVKNVLSKLNIKRYDSKNDLIMKSVNADTKQALATLAEVNEESFHKVAMPFLNTKDLLGYLESLNWMEPWTSGAQFSSLCVYSRINDNIFNSELESFATKLFIQETGSYHSPNLTSKREIINGAMKIITGLDWINVPIHNPKQLINFCLSNIPESEGCDIVDFVYVLYKCSNQVDYRKDEINKLFIEILEQIKKLYNEHDNAFSYFINKSQTHYYGAKISEGEQRADIHGSLLCLWAVLMILDSLGLKEKNLKIIKP